MTSAYLVLKETVQKRPDSNKFNPSIDSGRLPPKNGIEIFRINPFIFNRINLFYVLNRQLYPVKSIMKERGPL